MMYIRFMRRVVPPVYKLMLMRLQKLNDAMQAIAGKTSYQISRTVQCFQSHELIEGNSCDKL
jgi:hypothetical protein